MNNSEYMKQWRKINIPKRIKAGFYGYCKMCGKSNKEGYGKRDYCSYKCRGIDIKMKTPEANRICKNCNKKFRTNPAYLKRRKNVGVYCSRECFFEYKKNFPKESIDKSGYIRFLGKRKHRIIMEQFLNRKLRRGEVVHHKNGIKTDNRIDNLVIMENGKHTSLHFTKRKN